MKTNIEENFQICINVPWTPCIIISGLFRRVHNESNICLKLVSENKIERYWEYPVTKKVRGKYLNDMNILKFNNTCWTFSWMLNVWEGGVWQKTADIGKNIAWKVVKGTKLKNWLSNEGLIIQIRQVVQKLEPF